MMLGRVLGASLVATILGGCFAEPSTQGSSPGSTTAASSTGLASTSGSDPASSSGSESMSASGTGSETGSSTGPSTSIGVTSGSSSSGATSETTIAETTTGDPPAECDEGFGDLLSLSLGELETVMFTDAEPHTDVGLVVAQGDAAQVFTYVDAVPDAGGITWTFTAALTDEFIPGPASLRFTGFDEEGFVFESSCEIELN